MRIAQRSDSLFVAGLLGLQPGERPQAGGTGCAHVKKAAPRGRQLQEAQRVTSGRRVEHDMVHRLHQLILAEQHGEFVERSDLDRAGTGQLFLELGELCFRHRAPVGGHRPLAILPRCRLRIDVHRKQAWHARHGHRRIAERQLKHCIEVRGGIGAHQERASPPIG